MKIFFIGCFKVVTVLTLIVHLLFRMASEHAFVLPLIEGLGYSAMITAFFLVLILPSSSNGWRTVIKYLTVLSLAGVLLIAAQFAMNTFKVDFADWIVGFLFHSWDLLYIIVTAGVLFLVLTDRLEIRGKNVKSEELKSGE
jgi:hypothetical protein